MTASLSPAIIPVFYLGPVQYFTKFLRHNPILTEQCGNYIKQSYLNRCVILSANGPISLSIPVICPAHPKSLLESVLIDYHTPWNKIHWKAIESAYGKSPYFEFYADDFIPFYNRQYERLMDYNLRLLKLILRILGIDQPLTRTPVWQDSWPGFADYREGIHPKQNRRKDDPEFNAIPYYQVFSPRFGFVPNLSIIDLIFNEGPDAIEILQGSSAL